MLPHKHFKNREEDMRHAQKTCAIPQHMPHTLYLLTVSIDILYPARICIQEGGFERSRYLK